MTTTNNTKQQQIDRLTELVQLSRQRYLDAGGDPKLSVGSLNNNDRLTDKEQQEFRELFNQIVTDEDLAAYSQSNGTWRERLAAIEQGIRLGE
jgi:hypothetical protein